MDLQNVREILILPERTAEALVPVFKYLETLFDAEREERREKQRLADEKEDDLDDGLGDEEEDTEFVAVMRKLGDASRDEKWRLPIGESGILSLAAQVLDEKAGVHELQRQALRICGNTCAEQDVNREILISRPNGLKAFIVAITNIDLIDYAIPVLFNVIVNYEPAQKKAIEDGAGDALFQLLNQVDVVAEDVEDGTQVTQAEHLLKLADIFATHDSFKEGLDPSSLAALLRYTLSPKLQDLDLYSYLLTIITHLLGNVKFQRYLINTTSVKVLLDVLEDSYSRFSKDDSPETAKILTHLRKALIATLSDVSSNPAFPEKYPLETSSLLKKLHAWLSTPEVAPDSGNKRAYLLSEALQTSACIMLGNLATSDTACRTLVQTHRIHIPIIKIMGQKSKDAGTVYSAVGMLRNLVLPLENKPIVGSPDSGIWDALETRWEHALEGGIEKQVPYTVSGLGRVLVRGCQENVLQLLQKTKKPLPDSGDKITTRLSVLLRMWAKLDELPIKTEIARTVSELLRAIAKWKVTGDDYEEVSEVMRQVFNVEGKYAEYERLVPVVVSLVAQNKWPAMRSEGLFVFGLLCSGFGKVPGQTVATELDKEGPRKVWALREQWWEFVTGEKTVPGQLEPGKIAGEVGEDKKEEESEKKEEESEKKEEESEKKEEESEKKEEESEKKEEESEKKEEEEEEEEAEEKKPLEGKDYANALVMIAQIRERLVGELPAEENQSLDELFKKLVITSQLDVVGC
ncbi:armadillo-type protein [Peziza echinospora]|nr:armadillo-type protein [Peziza echinospora]